MTLHPMLAALTRHKVAVSLIVLQIALTLAIVANAAFVIGHRIERMHRPSGIEETGLLRVLQRWPGVATSDDPAAVETIDAMQRADLETLRQLPDVREVAASTSNPVLSGYTAGTIATTPDGSGRTVRAAYYYGDQHLRATFSLPLLAGRDFHTDEIRHGRARPDAPVVIISKPVADQLFPAGNALGQTIYQDGHPARIVGIVGKLQTPRRSDSTWPYNSVLEPLREDAAYSGYVVRVRAGREQAAAAAIRRALFAENPQRLMPPPWGGVRSFAEIREAAYRPDRDLVRMMGLTCLILLGVTAAGIVGLTSYWVFQRYRQIGIRRALGARRIDILRDFQTEDLLIVGSGSLLGAALAFGLNGWLMQHYEMARLPVGAVLLTVAIMLAIGQASSLVPARQASRVPPIVATHSD